MSILDIFLTPDPKRKANNTRRNRNNGNKPSINDYGLIAGAVIALVAMLLIVNPGGCGDDCPAEPTAGLTYVLVDLSEELEQLQIDDLNGTIRAAVSQPHPNQVIYTYQMSDGKPKFVEGFGEFKNQDFSEFFSGFGRAFNAESDCKNVNEDDFPWGKHIRKNQQKQIIKKCAEKIAHENKVVKATTIDLGKGKKQSPIITAIESLSYEAMKKSDDRAIDTRLIIFSDMLQNDEWFTQYTNETSNGKTRRVIKGNDHWTAEELRDARQRVIPTIGAPIYYKFNAVLICYLKHRDLNLPAFNKKHREMWNEYLNGYGYANEYRTADNGDCAQETKRILKNR